METIYYDTVLHENIWNQILQYGTVKCNVKLYDTICNYVAEYDAKWHRMTPYNTACVHAILSDTM